MEKKHTNPQTLADLKEALKGLATTEDLKASDLRGFFASLNPFLPCRTLAMPDGRSMVKEYLAIPYVHDGRQEHTRKPAPRAGRFRGDIP
jgi:hypothetical protein